MRVTRITDQITLNPDTGNYHVTDASGNVTGDTTQRDVAYLWAGQTDGGACAAPGRCCRYCDPCCCRGANPSCGTVSRVR